MKSKLVLFYQLLLNTYFFNQKNDIETSKRNAYVAIRNVIGVVVFMFSLLLFVVFTSVFDITLDLKRYRLIGYFIMGVLVFSYLSFSKKYVKPMFDNVELGDNKTSKMFFPAVVVLFGLFGGLMYTISRLLNYYFH